MIIDEEAKSSGEVSADALEAVFADDSDSIVEEEVVFFSSSHEEEDANDLDIPFTDDHDDW